MESKVGALLLFSRGFPTSAPRTGRVAFTTSSAPTNHVVILAMPPDVPPGGTLYRVPWLGFVGLDLRPLFPSMYFWCSSGLGGGPVLLGVPHRVGKSLHFWLRLTFALLRFVLVTILVDLEV